MKIPFENYVLHAIFLYKKRTHLVFETEDNQLDFNALTIKSIQKEDFQYELKQVTEVIKRKVHFDPIRRFAFAINNGRFYGIAIRNSNNFDLYRDLIKVETPLAKAVEAD